MNFIKSAAENRFSIWRTILRMGENSWNFGSKMSYLRNIGMTNAIILFYSNGQKILLHLMVLWGCFEVALRCCGTAQNAYLVRRIQLMLSW